jgi:hypothetical protein
VFDPANIPSLMAMSKSSGFDSEAISTANLTGDERSAFKSHLRKCWKLPANASSASTTRVSLRVFLKPNGALAQDPVLIAAGSPTGDGPAIFQTAIRALKSCAPFAFLPAEKYREWKVLDLTVTARDMAGG